MIAVVQCTECYSAAVGIDAAGNPWCGFHEHTKGPLRPFEEVPPRTSMESPVDAASEGNKVAEGGAPSAASTIERLRAALSECTAAPWEADARTPDDVVLWGPEDPSNPEHAAGNFLGNVGASRVSQVGVAFDIDAKNGIAIALLRNLAPALLDVAQAAEAYLSAQDNMRDAIGAASSGDRVAISPGLVDAAFAGDAAALSLRSAIARLAEVQP
jgi:hypothetical protein